MILDQELRTCKQSENKRKGCVYIDVGQKCLASDTSPDKAFTNLQKNLSLRSDFL
ncbi:MAG: hypothetical protein SFU27_02560 [Thermonemataceae bacterium]|nr:hypothetical protein [Thermonemataceae bacterium]